MFCNGNSGKTSQHQFSKQPGVCHLVKLTCAAYRRLLSRSALCLATLLLSTAPVHADVVVPATGFMSLSSGGLDAFCTDVIVAGTLQTNSAPVINVRHVIIQSGGTLDAGSSSFSLGGNWSNAGTFTASGSSIVFGDSCAVNPSSVSGNNTFNNLSFVSSSGKTWQFAASATQTVLGLLNIQGAPGNPLQLVSSVPGQAAAINPLGTQTTANFVSTNVNLGPLPAPVVAAIPTLNEVGMLLLSLLLGAGAVLHHIRSRPTRRP